MNHTHMHGVIADMEPDAEVVFMVRLTDPAFAGTAWREKSGGCPTRVTEFMAQHPRTRVRCISAKLSQCRWPFRVPSGGFVALAVLFERYQCETVRLYGFANANASLPYHYWSEGSLHDGVSTRDWYGRRSKVHNFTHEHLLMHDVLGRCSWHATATRYREYCRKQESSAYANSRRCAGGGAASAIVEHQDERNVRSASCHTNAPASAAAAPPGPSPFSGRRCLLPTTRCGDRTYPPGSQRSPQRSKPSAPPCSTSPPGRAVSTTSRQTSGMLCVRRADYGQSSCFGVVRPTFPPRRKREEEKLPHGHTWAVASIRGAILRTSDGGAQPQKLAVVLAALSLARGGRKRRTGRAQVATRDTRI